MDKLSERVQNMYLLLVKEGKLTQAEGLKTITGIKPDDEVTQIGYSFCLGRTPYNDVCYWRAITDKPPHEKTLDKAYSRLLEKGWIDFIIWTSDSTGIKPRFTKNELMNFHKSCLTEKPSKLPEAKRLKEFTGQNIEMSPDFVHEAYSREMDCAISKGDLSGIQRIYDFTQIKPEVQQKAKQFYEKWIINRSIEVKKLIQLTQEKPTEKLVQKAYSELILNAEIGKIEFLKANIGIKPKVPVHIAEEGWNKAASESYLNALHFQRSTELEMPKKIANRFYEEYAGLDYQRNF